MAYRELIKNFARIRSYMREFYVYGFKSREEYTEKSVRSYDNERRRVESWLGEHMSFHQDAGGKNVFLSMDSRRIPHNPLYKAFKAKSFTDKDITLHFYILDLLADGSALSAGEMTDRICTVYLSRFTDALTLDESTVRKKLKEYESLGLLRAEKSGREVLYRRTDSEHPALVAFKKHQNIETLNREILIDLVNYIKVYENGNISVKFKFADEFRRIAEYIEINISEIPAAAG